MPEKIKKEVLVRKGSALDQVHQRLILAKAELDKHKAKADAAKREYDGLKDALLAGLFNSHAEADGSLPHEFIIKGSKTRVSFQENLNVDGPRLRAELPTVYANYTKPVTFWKVTGL